MTDSNKPILCLDFDGVLHSYTSGWQGADVIPDPPVNGAIDFLREAVKHFEVNIFSSRSGQAGGIYAMERWIESWARAHRATDDECLAWVSSIEYPTEKPPAMIGIDDRVLTFDGHWPAMNRLLNFKPWNKRAAFGGTGKACIPCASGNDVPPGETCVVCGRQGVGFGA